MSKTTFTAELNPRSNKDGSYTVYLRIYKDGKYKRVNLGVSVRKEEWNTEKREVRKSNKNAEMINTLIRKKISEGFSEDVLDKVSNSNRSLSAIQKKLKDETTGGDFFEFATIVINQMQNSGSQRVYRTVLAKLKEYQNELDFCDITRGFLINYEKWLREVKGNNKNTIHKNLTTIRTLYYEAARREVFEPTKNPWLLMKINKVKSNRSHFTFDEIKLLENIELIQGSQLFHARNIFLMQYYAYGTRIADMLLMKWVNLKDGRLEFLANKTGKQHSVKLPSEAKLILEYYKERRRNIADYIFPYLKKKQWETHLEFRQNIESMTAQVNKNLKKLVKMIGINKNISTHVARHSFAENARIKTGNDIYAISKALGHSNISITEAYFGQSSQGENDAMSTIVFG
jgi:site-specific recombinase XerD